MTLRPPRAVRGLEIIGYCRSGDSRGTGMIMAVFGVMLGLKEFRWEWLGETFEEFLGPADVCGLRGVPSSS